MISAAELPSELTSRFPPADCHFSPFGGSPYFPLDPGLQWIYRGTEHGQSVELVVTSMNETREITLNSDEESRTIVARIFDERNFVNEILTDVGRLYYARCVETGDVYSFGSEVTMYSDAGTVIHEESSWLAGSGGAQPGIIMPGRFAVGARYFNQREPGIKMDLAVNSATGVTDAVPAGTFSGCVRIIGTDTLRAATPSMIKIFAPGVGLINDSNRLKLTAFSAPETSGGSPILSILGSLTFSWPITERPFRLESSPDLKTWNFIRLEVLPFDGRNRLSVPRDTSMKYFRLVPR